MQLENDITQQTCSRRVPYQMHAEAKTFRVSVSVNVILRLIRRQMSIIHHRSSITAGACLLHDNNVLYEVAWVIRSL
jgi:hypothetical protein